jgi:hypothetical protein
LGGFALLSLVLYGRNDNHGYNLHKRAALSLNCMAEVLSDPQDEIIFVDYNTPDDFPTFPEAIADTLTERARKHLRILRVRPSIHGRFADRTHLPALEPIARNIALRRSNPANRWILSTNTDMIFVPRVSRSLSESVRELPDGHYGLPRFEVPETLWETLDRRDPRKAIDLIGQWGWTLHLNEVVRGMRPFLFDGPGDFQLMLRDDLFSIGGFDEDMLLGWHVDANIAKRMSFLHGDVRDLSDHVFGYHCDHTRQITAAHRSSAAQNDSNRFFHDVVRAELTAQAHSWGCPDDSIEEVRLEAAERYVEALVSLSQPALSTPTYAAYVPETYNTCSYSPQHVLPFLLDLFASLPRTSRVAWLGHPGPMMALFARAWRDLGFTSAVQIHQSFQKDIETSTLPMFEPCTLSDMAQDANAFVFDFSRGDGSALKPSSARDRDTAKFLGDAFGALISAEEVAARRFIGINALHTQFEGTFSSNVNCAKTPFGIRIRHGFAFKQKTAEVTTLKPSPRSPSVSATPCPVRAGRTELDLLGVMQTGPAGLRRGDRIDGQAGIAGLVARTGLVQIPRGPHRVSLELRGRASNPLATDFDLLVTEVLTRVRRLLGYRLERRLRRLGSRLAGRRLSSLIGTSLRKRFGVSANTLRTTDSIVRIEAHRGDELIGSMRVLGNDIAHWSRDLEIEIADDLVNDDGEGVVISLLTNGGAKFSVLRMSVRASNALQPEDLQQSSMAA